MTHFDGDGCAVYDRTAQLYLLPAASRPFADRRRVSAEELEEGDIWQAPGDGVLTWWYADEVVILESSGDEVHIEYSEADPFSGSSRS